MISFASLPLTILTLLITSSRATLAPLYSTNTFTAVSTLAGASVFLAEGTLFEGVFSVIFFVGVLVVVFLVAVFFVVVF